MSSQEKVWLHRKNYIAIFETGREGSPVLEDLKTLEKEGTRICTCGTCLDFYKMKEKLAVGTVVNMYVIAETQSKADLIIKP